MKSDSELLRHAVETSGRPMHIGSLFSGIGLLELGLEQSGLGHTVWQVEKSRFCRKVLRKHWPQVKRYKDVKKVGKKNLCSVDLICGGFPCQDISSAGKGRGLAGERSGLWFEFARIIGEMRPSWVVIENVASGAKRWVDQVMARLEQLDYEALAIPLSAEDVGAPHRRARVFVVAYAIGQPVRQQPRGSRGAHGKGEALARQYGETGDAAYAGSQRLAQWKGQRSGVQRTQQAVARVGRARPIADPDRDRESAEPEHAQVARLPTATGHGGWEWGPPVSPVCGVDDGGAYRMDELGALGNAVVPQCSETIGYVIRLLANV